MSAKPSREPKSCRVCGREITWRKRWEKVWDEVTTCSDACRKRRHELTGRGAELETLLLELARERHPKSLCPSEVARRLVAKGLVHITQGGRAVDPSTARGAIRVVLAC